MNTLPFATFADVQEPAPAHTPTGRKPWRIVPNHKGLAGVLDADGRTLFIAPADVANDAVNAVNQFHVERIRLARIIAGEDD